MVLPPKKCHFYGNMMWINLGTLFLEKFTKLGTWSRLIWSPAWGEWRCQFRKWGWGMRSNSNASVIFLWTKTRPKHAYFQRPYSWKYIIHQNVIDQNWWCNQFAKYSTWFVISIIFFFFIPKKEACPTYVLSELLPWFTLKIIENSTNQWENSRILKWRYYTLLYHIRPIFCGSWVMAIDQMNPPGSMAIASSVPVSWVDACQFKRPRFAHWVICPFDLAIFAYHFFIWGIWEPCNTCFN